MSSPGGNQARGLREPVGMAGVVAALSVTSDLTRGHPPGEAMRACLLATELAAALGGDDVIVRARGDMIDAAATA